MIIFADRGSGIAWTLLFVFPAIFHLSSANLFDNGKIGKGYTEIAGIFGIAPGKTPAEDDLPQSEEEVWGALLSEYTTLVETGKINETLSNLDMKTSISGPEPIRERRDVSGNRPPVFNGPVLIYIVIGKQGSAQITATDPDGDDLVISFTRKSDIAQVTKDGKFSTFPPVGLDFTNYLAGLVQLEFKVTDGKGGEDFLLPEWHLCGCANDGLCDHDNLATSTGRIHVSGCICTDAYTGPTCQADKNECAEGEKCAPGVQCYDNPAPKTGYRCGPCLEGHQGDGKDCESKCASPTIRNGNVLAKDFSAGSTVAFTCHVGYQILGEKAIICGKDGTYNKAPPTCEDEDECFKSPCHADAKCVNTIGSYMCICNEDFVGDGYDVCKPLIRFEHISCDVLGNDSIRVNWQISETWRRSPVIDQFIITWFRADEFGYEVEEDFRSYLDQFDTYEEKLEDVAAKETVASLQYQAVGRTESSFVITGLEPNTQYRIGTRIQHVEGEVMNPMRDCNAVTKEGISSPPLDLEAEEVYSSSIVLSWNSPDNAQGIIIGYVIDYKQASSCDGTDACEHTKTVQVVAGQSRVELLGLLPSTAYLIRIAAVNGAGIGKYSSDIKAITRAHGENVNIEIGKEPEGGVCFEASFIVVNEWTSNLLQQSLLIGNLKKTMYDVLQEIKPGAFDIRDLTLHEVDDVTSVNINIYIMNESITSNLDFSQWSNRIVQAIVRNSGRKPWLQNLRHSSIVVDECNECKRPETNICGVGTQCINFPGSYICQCKPGFIAVTRSAVSSFPITCKWNRGAEPTTEPATKPPTYPACENAKYDIVFLVDSSRSVTGPSFQKVLNAAKTFIEEFVIGSYDTQVALVQYSRDIKVAFHLNTFKDKDELLEAFTNVPYSGLGTRTGQAIQKLQDQVLTHSRGHRKLNQLHVVIVTDGKSADSVNEAFGNLHEITRNVYAIGVADQVDEYELIAIAGKDGQVIRYDSYDTLQEEMPAQLRSLICPSYSCQDHNDYMDVVFALESTASINEELFTEMKRFMRNVVEELNVGRSATQVSAVTMGAGGSVEFRLNQYKTKDRIMEAINDITNPGTDSKVFIGKGMGFLEYNILQPRRGRRLDAGLVIIMITGGNSADDYEDAVTVIRKYGAAIHTVGVAHPKRSNLDELSRPDGTVFVANAKNMNSPSLNLKTKMLTEMRKSASCLKKPRCKKHPKRLRKIIKEKPRFC